MMQSTFEEKKQDLRKRFPACSVPMRQYLEQLFAVGEYRYVVQIAREELGESPCNIDMILYQAASVVEMQARGMDPFSPERVHHALEQLQVLVDAAPWVDIPFASKLGYYVALGNLLLGNVEAADQMMVSAVLHDPFVAEQYAFFREQWGHRVQISPRKWRIQRHYVS